MLRAARHTDTLPLAGVLAGLDALPIAGTRKVATPTGARPWLALADGRPLTDARGRARHFATWKAARDAAGVHARRVAAAARDGR